MPDTWFYAKRCFISLAENLSKHMLPIGDDSYREILTFLDAADAYGKNTYVTPEQPLDTEETERRTVSQEARIIKRTYLKLRG